MKKLIAPALLAVLLLSGCSPAAAPTPTPTPAKASVPRPSEAQGKALVAELQKVKPELTGSRALVTAKAGCQTILRGGADAEQVAQVSERLKRTSNTAVSPEDAKRIIEIIKTNGFCTTDG